jgi:hypothetical protein
MRRSVAARAREEKVCMCETLRRVNGLAGWLANHLRLVPERAKAEIDGSDRAGMQNGRTTRTARSYCAAASMWSERSENIYGGSRKGRSAWYSMRKGKIGS